jgi:hypothetical protein
MKTVLIIIALLVGLNAMAQGNKVKKSKRSKLPPLELRCTEEDSKGRWCIGWSVEDEECFF